MAKKHLSVTVSQECYDIVMSYKETNRVTTSDSVEELIKTSKVINKEPSTMKDDILLLIEQAKKIERKIREKENKKVMS